MVVLLDVDRTAAKIPSIVSVAFYSLVHRNSQHMNRDNPPYMPYIGWLYIYTYIYTYIYICRERERVVMGGEVVKVLIL